MTLGGLAVLATGFALLAPAAHAAVKPGLVGAWGFDETAGTAVKDISGNAYDGTVASAARTAGRFGGALSFNGTSSLVTVPDAAKLDLSSALTLEAWVKPSTLSGSWRTVVMKESDALSYALYAADDSTRPSGHVWTTKDSPVRSTSGLALNQWTHLATTYDSSSAKLYVNGALAATQAITGPVRVSSGALRMGGNRVWPEYFKGLIDEVRVYDRALSASEIQSDSLNSIASDAAALLPPALPPALPVPPAPADTQRPTTPQSMAWTTKTQNSIGLGWNASTDNVRVAGYRIYRNGAAIGTTTSLSYNITGLACGTSYQIGLTAYDAAGNESIRAEATGTTSTNACTPTPTPTPSPTPTPTPTPTVTPDTERPTTPQDMAWTTKTQTAIGVRWTASTDNRGVTGYRIYRNGTVAGTTSSLSYTVTGLVCGTSYDIGLTAYDAAGNESIRAESTGTTTTEPCTPTPTPTPTATPTATPTPSATPSPTATPTPTATPNPGNGTANLWIDADGGSCTRQGTPGGYNSSQACANFNAAYQAAQPGDVVNVKGGSYGGQTMSAKASAAAPAVTITSAPGEQVTINGTVQWSGADHLTVKGPMRIIGQISASYPTGCSFNENTDYATIDGVTINMQSSRGSNGNESTGCYVKGGTNYVTIKNSDICCNIGKLIFIEWATGARNKNTVIDNNLLRDQAWTGDNTSHQECIYVNAPENLTISRNVFWRCRGTSAINFTQSGPNATEGPRNMLVENNVFELGLEPNTDKPLTFGSIQGCLQCVGTNVMRNNLWLQEPILYPQAKWQLIANVGPMSSCASGTTYRSNVFTSRTCGTGDVVRNDALSTSYYENTAAHNWRYKSNHPAIGRGDATSTPLIDLFGTPRPQGGAPDAGPVELP